MTNLVGIGFRKALLGFAMLGILIPSSYAVASPKKKKAAPVQTQSRKQAATVEQFKAVDAGQTIGIDNDANTAFYEDSDHSSAKTEVSTPAPTAASETATSPVAKSALLPKDRGNYERVPNESKDSIAKRLKIIETLILEYGRAYDYRIHTTKELNAILDDLKKKTPPDNAPQSS